MIILYSYYQYVNNNDIVRMMHLLIGDWEGGDRGIAAIPGREREFKDSLQKSLQYAKALECKRFVYRYILQR